MNPLAKVLVTNKLSNVGKSMGLDDKKDNDDNQAFSAKEIRKMQEKDASERAKREESYAKRSAERGKKREEIRAKYGIQKDGEKGRKGQPEAKSKTTQAQQSTSEREDSKCVVM